MGKILYAGLEGAFILKFEGDVRVTLGPAINAFLDDLVQCGGVNTMVVDMSDTSSVDSTALGILAKIGIRCREKFGITPTIFSPHPDITRTMTTMGFESLFVIVPEAPAPCGDLAEKTTGQVTESDLREQVLEAHHVLMEMNDTNRAEFRDLVAALEAESAGESERRVAASR